MENSLTVTGAILRLVGTKNVICFFFPYGPILWACLKGCIDDKNYPERRVAGPSGHLSDILPDIEILTAQYRAYRIEILSSFGNIILSTLK